MSGQQSRGAIAEFFLFVADRTNGRKTVSSIIVLVGGVIVFVFQPEHKEAGIGMIVAGIQGAFFGIAHKYVKKHGG